VFITKNINAKIDISLYIYECPARKSYANAFSQKIIKRQPRDLARKSFAVPQ